MLTLRLHVCEIYPTLVGAKWGMFATMLGIQLAINGHGKHLVISDNPCSKSWIMAPNKSKSSYMLGICMSEYSLL